MVAEGFSTLSNAHVFNVVLRRVRELADLANSDDCKAALRIALGVAQAAVDEQRRQHYRGRPSRLILDPVASALDDAREMLKRAATGTQTADFSRLPDGTPESSRYGEAYEGELARLTPVVDAALNEALKDARWSHR
jgi:uncharacterized protein (DUF885 family)